MSGIWWVPEDKLHDEQRAVLNTEFDVNLLIQGPPGSGKTNLLLLRANHIHIAENPEFYIVTYTKTLANFIRTGADKYKFPANKIITRNKLYETVLNDHGIEVKKEPGENFEIRSEKLRAGMQILMDSNKGKASFPYLFIDEAQDYDLFDIKTFFYLAGNISLSADLRQGIYKLSDSASGLISENCKALITLIFHYRTGKRILAVADKVMAGKLGHIPMLDSSQYDEDNLPSDVEHHPNLSLDEQIAMVSARLPKQLDAYPNQILGVLVPRDQEFKIVWESLSTNPLLADKVTNVYSSYDFDPTKPIWVSKIHSAKGLEFRAVHLLAAEFTKNFNAHSRRVVFTAITRAKTLLIIYNNEELDVFFSSALSKKNDKEIRFEQLFGAA